MKTNDYTKEQIKAVIEGVNHYFPSFAGDTQGNVYVNDSWSALNKTYKWKNRDDFFTTLSEITGVQNLTDVKKAISILYDFETQIQSPEKIDSNTVSSEQLKQFEKEAEARNEVQKQADLNAKKDVEASIKRQQEIYAQEIQKAKVEAAILRAENKKVYYKTNEVSSELNQQTEANPKQFIEDTTKQFEKSSVVQNLSPEEAHIVSEQAATTTYEVFSGNSPVIQVAILKQVVADPQTSKEFKDIAEILIDQKTAQFELAKQFINLPENITVEFSNIPKEGFRELDLSEIPEEHLQNLRDQNNFLGSIQNFGEGEIRSQLLLNVGARIESRIATLPANSLLAKTYNSEVVQLGLQSLGVVQVAPWAAVEGSFMGKLAIGSGFGPVAGFIQTKTGINLGVKLATTAITKTVATTAAAGAGAATTGAAAGAAAGSIIPGAGTLVGAIIGFVSTEIIGKVIKKLPWDKLKKIGPAIAGLAVGIPAALITGSIATAVMLGGGVAAGTALLSGGLPALQATASSFGSGLMTIGGAIFKASLGEIGKPILATFLIFPLVVALILFIINSGAYVVPPGFSSGGTPDIICNATQGKAEDSGSPAANAAVCIVSYLDQFHLNPLLVGLLNSAGWQKLATTLPGAALGALESSAHVDGHLQCVGFTAATAGFAYGQAFDQINACSYIEHAPPGYKYISGTTGIKSGDFFLIAGNGGCYVPPNFSPGHIGVVVSVDGTLISCADANSVAPGKARTGHGCFALSQLAGYLRKQ